MNNFQSGPAWTPNLDALRRRSGDAAARKFLSRELDRFDKLQALRDEMHQPIAALAAAEKLKAEGIVPDAKLFKAAILEWREDNREKFHEHVNGLILASLEKRCDPEMKRIMRKVVDELRESLADIRRVCAAIGKRHDVDNVSTGLEAGIQAAVDRFEQDIAGQLKLGWHGNPRVAMSSHFEEGL